MVHKIKKMRLGLGQIAKIQGTLQLLKNLGIKATKSRRNILEVLVDNPTPITADKIYSTLKYSKINLTTVYRVLASFEAVSLVKKVNIPGNAIKYEINNHHHHHIICNNCGIIEEIDDCDIEQRKPKSEKFNIINEHSLEFFGTCKSCVKS